MSPIHEPELSGDMHNLLEGVVESAEGPGLAQAPGLASASAPSYGHAQVAPPYIELEDMANALPAAAQALVAATMTGSTGAAGATGAVPLNAASLHEFEVESMTNALPATTQDLEIDNEAPAEVAPAEEAAPPLLQLQHQQGARSLSPTTSTSPNASPDR